MVVIALFSCRSPPRLSRCRSVLPEDAGIGQVPARLANADSERTPARVRPGDEDGGGDDRSYAEELPQLRGVLVDQSVKVLAVVYELDVQGDDPRCQPARLGPARPLRW